VASTDTKSAWHTRTAASACAEHRLTTRHAIAIAAWLRSIKKGPHARPDVLDAVVGGRVKLIDAYNNRDDPARILSLRRSTDLDRLATEWERAGANAKYVAQVRRMIPRGKPYPHTKFTRAAVRQFLDSLTKPIGGPGLRFAKSDKPVPASAATKNRYRAGLSSFAGRLVEREVLQHNVVRDVKQARVPHRAVIYLEPAQAKALVKALPTGQQQALEALMAATGLE
jgi:hypothetical protein